MDNNIDIRLEALRIAGGDIDLARTYVDFILDAPSKGFIERMREEEAKRAEAERAKRRLNARFGKLADEPVNYEPFNLPKGTTDEVFRILLEDLNTNSLFGKFAGGFTTYTDTDSVVTDDVATTTTRPNTFHGEPLSTGAIMQLNSVYGKTPTDPDSGWCVDCDTMHHGGQWKLLEVVFGSKFVERVRVPNTAA